MRRYYVEISLTSTDPEKPRSENFITCAEKFTFTQELIDNVPDNAVDIIEVKTLQALHSLLKIAEIEK
jgi:hypothetical protein